MRCIKCWLLTFHTFNWEKKKYVCWLRGLTFHLHRQKTKNHLSRALSLSRLICRGLLTVFHLNKRQSLIKEEFFGGYNFCNFDAEWWSLGDGVENLFMNDAGIFAWLNHFSFDQPNQSFCFFKDNQSQNRFKYTPHSRLWNLNS